MDWKKVLWLACVLKVGCAVSHRGAGSHRTVEGVVDQVEEGVALVEIKKEGVVELIYVPTKKLSGKVVEGMRVVVPMDDSRPWPSVDAGVPSSFW